MGATTTSYNTRRAALQENRQKSLQKSWLMRSPPSGRREAPSSALFRQNRQGHPPQGVSPAGGLRMLQDYEHEPVMVDEVVAAFREVPPGTVVDATVGGGGHASALLDANRHLRVIGIDRDPAAVSAARAKLAAYGDRARVRQSRFDALADVASSEGVRDGELSGVLFDLGMSSAQLASTDRGFSYRHDGPLDMRMDPSDPGSPTAAELLNNLPEGQLARMLASNGEGRGSSRLARRLVARRPYSTTEQLADAVRDAIPPSARRRGHPAARVFQALRIAVNDELEQLADVLPQAVVALRPRGRCVTIAYHSGEDRIVKAAFAEAETGGCACPPGLPCACGAVPLGRVLTRGARKPSAEEVQRNSRAASARLRVFVRNDSDPHMSAASNVTPGPGSAA